MWMRAALIGLAAGLLGACTAPTPTASATPTPTPSPAAATASASAQPTPTPVPTPAPTLAIQDIDIFQGGPQDWVMASTETNVNGIAEVAVLRAITETVEIYADCVGDGQLAVSVGASPPAGSAPPDVAASPYTMTSFTLDCPDAQTVSIGGAAPPGWFISPRGAPSDPSVRYQILVATTKP